MDTSVALDLNELFSAKGLVAVVTGGGSGIGLAIASALGKTGASRVYILGRRLSALGDAARSIGSCAIPIECDVTQPASVAAAVAKVEQEVGYIDVLINNAGILGPDHKSANTAGSIDELQQLLLADSDKWAPTFAINSTAVVGVSAAFLKLLDAGNKRRGWESGKLEDRARKRDTYGLSEKGIAADDKRSSQIITVASIAGLNRFITAGLAYGASKAAAISLGKALAHLLAPWGIRSNIINPGIYPSAMTAGSKEEYPYKEIPAGRKGTFYDMAAVVLQLVGKGGAYINGNMTITDGGRLSVMPATY